MYRMLERKSIKSFGYEIGYDTAADSEKDGVVNSTGFTFRYGK